MYDFTQIEKKWQHKWQAAKIFESDADLSRKKFFCHFTYPYVNAYPHLGHFYTLMRPEVFGRFKRLQGYNVLMPQAWHATGSPIITAAKRVQEKEEKQLKILKDMGIDDSIELKKFEEAKYWIEFFAPEFTKDFKAMGIGTDWRRTYYTTELNPWYDRFIRWQFNKLKEKNYVIQGKFPVVWCTKCHNPVSDHSRSEGEGETPQEFTLMKFSLVDYDTNDDAVSGDKKVFLIAATLRPETLFGITNMWVNPKVTYVQAIVDGEQWIISKECFAKLGFQDHTLSLQKEVVGTSLLGKYCLTPMSHKKVIILPGEFSNPAIGSGIVTSVPSHASFDWMGLVELKNNKAYCEKFGLDYSEINLLTPISLIALEGYGEHAAEDVCKRLKITSTKQEALLEQAKKEVYKAEHFSGIMKANTAQYAGMKVEEAKELIKKELVAHHESTSFYELTGRVVCRCLTPSIVKIVEDQWFIDYANPEWKAVTKKALQKIRLYPEIARAQFEYTIDWLKAWACSREEGLGTKLPWDEKWLIESLSDSTIYLAFYPISHYLQQVNPAKITDAVFDYIMLDKGKKPEIEFIDQMKQEFDYWYPFDFNSSGKDLIQNHLTFALFNHTAIFPEKKWPNGYGLNGWVMVDGKKMSKSLGNFILMRELIPKYSADASRFTIMNGGEGMDDPNWDNKFAESFKVKLEQFYTFCIDHYRKGTDDWRSIDQWMESVLHDTIKEVTFFMEETLFRTASQKIFFELNKALKWYFKRTKNNPNQKLLGQVIEAQVIMMSVFTPFVCEEIWEKIGKQGFVSQATWPQYQEEKINKQFVYAEQLIATVVDDISSVLKLVKITPQKIILFTAEQWKYELFAVLRAEFEKTRNPHIILKNVLSHDQFKQYGDVVSAIVQRTLKSGIVHTLALAEQEYQSLVDALSYLQDEYSLAVTVVKAIDAEHPKAKQALPGRPSLLVE